MAKIIQQTIRFKVSPEELFRTYLDSKRHAAVIGSKVLISRKPGGKFMAFDGMISGKNLLIIPNRLIVQAWRAKPWEKRDPDSILILQFRRATGGGQIELAHIDVPAYDHAGVTKGWHKYYWKPWKRYLKRRSSYKERSGP